jgi:hypothetical protein
MAEKDKIKLRLMVDVDYTPNGVSLDELKQMLLSFAEYGFGNGRFTGCTPAEVEQWQSRVDVRE